jgi:trehalose/maltose hydrolase-like predicted phosphorylase
MLLKTLLTGLGGNHGNTADGIHAAAAGAVWQVMLMGFLGMERDGESIRLSPNLPKIWKSIRLQICWKTEKIPFDIK